MIRRNILRLLPLAALLAFLPVTVGLAQNPSAPTSSVPGLTLSPAQQARFAARNAQFRKDVTALKADPKLTPAQKQTKFVALYKAVDKDMLAILTPAQRALVLKQRAATATFQKAHAAQFKEGQTLAAQLNKTLTKDQQQRLGALNAAEQAQLHQIDQDKTLSLAAKQQKEQAVDIDAQTKLQAVLTPAQRALFTRMMQIKSLAAPAGAPAGQ